MKIKHI